MLQSIVNGLCLGGSYAMVAIGFSIIFSATRTFHFAHGGVYLWSAYAMSALLGMGVPLWAALLCGCAVAIALGVGLEAVVYEPMRKKGATNLSLFVASLGSLIFLENVSPLVFGPENKSVDLGLPPSIDLFGGVQITAPAGLQFVVAVVMLGVVAAVLKWTTFGRDMRAVSSNAKMAALTGVSRRRVYLLAFGFGSLLAAPAALLNTATSGIDPGIGQTVIVTTLISVIVGGVGSVTGAAIGAWIIGMCQSLSTLVVTIDWQSAIAFGVLIIFILFRPLGLFGKKSWETAV